jgi:hypothetical protein
MRKMVYPVQQRTVPRFVSIPFFCVSSPMVLPEVSGRIYRCVYNQKYKRERGPLIAVKGGH